MKKFVALTLMTILTFCFAGCEEKDKTVYSTNYDLYEMVSGWEYGKPTDEALGGSDNAKDETTDSGEAVTDADASNTDDDNVSSEGSDESSDSGSTATD